MVFHVLLSDYSVASLYVFSFVAVFRHPLPCTNWTTMPASRSSPACDARHFRTGSKPCPRPFRGIHLLLCWQISGQKHVARTIRLVLQMCDLEALGCGNMYRRCIGNICPPDKSNRYQEKIQEQTGFRNESVNCTYPKKARVIAPVPFPRIQHIRCQHAIDDANNVAAGYS